MFNEKALLSHVVTAIGRKRWHVNRLDTATYTDAVQRDPADENANLISSECDDGQHAPIFDIDFGAYLIPSSSPGQFHLYFEKKIPWDKYLPILEAMRDAGLLQDYWVKSAKKDGRAYLRLPHVSKGDNP